jgi:hypothetical protein
VPLTGVWNCCGDPEHFSMYCESQEQRDSYRDMLQKEQQRKLHDKFVREARKTQLQSHMQTIATKNAQSDEQEQARKLAVIEDQRRRGVFDPVREAELERLRLKELTYNGVNQMTDKEKDLTHDTRMIAQAGDEDRVFHAPVLVSWLMKSFHESSTCITGLDFVWEHVQSGEGCVLLVKHGLVDALKRIHYDHLANFTIQLKVVRVLRRLLDCNFTRDVLLTEKLDDTGMLSACMFVFELQCLSFHVHNR